MEEKEFKKPRSKTKSLVYLAVSIAFLIVCAQIVVPLGFTGVSVTMATAALYVIGGLFGGRFGSLVVIIYLIAGLIGLPVFAAFGSTATIVGVTGGYLIGYIFIPISIGLMSKLGESVWFTVLGMIIGTVLLYLAGTLWYMFVTQADFGVALVMCVVPFLAGDALKILCATLITKRLKGVVGR